MTQVFFRDQLRSPLIGAMLAVICLCGCLRSPEQKEAAFIARGKEYYAKQDYVRAMLLFKNASRVTPKDAEPHYQMGLVYLASGDPNSAFWAFSKAVELNPKHKNAELKMAGLMVSARNSKDLLQDARKRLNDVLVAEPQNAEALNTLALTDWQMGKQTDAEKRLHSVLLRFPANLQATVSLALMKLTQHDLQGAEEVLKKAAEHRPVEAPTLEALGEFYALTNRNAEAEAAFQQALQVDPNNPMCLLDFASLLARSGRTEQAEKTYLRLSQLHDKRYSDVHAVFLFQSGKRDEAIREFERLAKQDPQDRAARTRLVEAYLRAKRFPDAEVVVASALEKNRRDVDALLQQAQIFLIANKLSEAQNDLNQVLRYKPESAEAHYLLSKFHEARHSPLMQRQELGEVLRIDSRFFRARIELAQLLLGSNASKSALTVLDQAHDDQKQTLSFIVQRNWALFRIRDKAEFRKGIEQGLAVRRQPDLVLQDAVAKLWDRDYAGARRSTQELLRSNPNDLRALDVQARAQAAQKGPAAALQEVKDYGAQHPKSPIIQQFVGEVMWTNGHSADARNAFTSALSIDPNNTTVQVELAYLDAGEGRLADARQSLTRLLSVDGRNVAARFLLAELEHKAGNLQKAIQLYREVLEAEPNHALALNNLAYLLADFAKQPDVALQLAQKAKELAPDNPSIEDTLGWVLYQKGLYDLAVTHLKNAASKRILAQPQYHLAMAYFKAGDLKSGRQALDSALRMDPKLPEAASAQHLLAQVAKNR